MAVAPHRGQPIAPHAGDLPQCESVWSQSRPGSAMHLPHDIRLPFATRARAGPPQLLQRDICLGAIIPFDGQFLSNRLDPEGLH